MVGREDDPARKDGNAEAWLALAVARSPAIHYVVEATGDAEMPTAVRFVSDNVAAITGHAALAFLDDPDRHLSCIHGDDRAAYLEAIEACAGDGVQELEYRFADASGAFYWVRDSLRRIEGGAGAVTFAGCMIDVTAEVRSRSQLMEAVEQLPNGFTLYDKDDRLVLANRALRKAYGIDQRSLRGSSHKALIRRLLPHVSSFDGEPVEASDAWAERISRRLGDLGAGAVEISLKDGSWRLLTSQATGDGGRVVISTDITPQKQAEAALRKSEQHFRTLVERHPLPVLLVEAQSGRIVYESPAVAALTGREWRPGETPSVLQHYADPKDRERLLAALRKTGELHNYETRFKRTDGTLIWVAANARLIEDEGRELVITSLVDLGAQRAREAELRRARETLEDAIESLSEGFALFDAEDRLVMCNSQFRDFNSETGDVLQPGITWADFNRIGAERGQYSAAKGRLGDWLKDLEAEHGKATNREFEQSDGRWFEYSHRTTRQNGLVVTRRDITERKRMESALREEQELVRRVLESAPVPISMTRLRDRFILYESPAMSAIFLEDDSNRAAHAGTYDTDPSQRAEYLRRICEDGAVDNFEIHFRRLDGSEFTGAVSGRRIDYHGDAAVVAVTIDLSEIKNREVELRHARETLEDAIESLNEGFVLFDAEERFVMCNRRYLEFNSKSADKLRPGVPRIEFLRTALERGQYPEFVGRERKTLEDYEAEGGLAAALGRAFEFEQDDGRWFIGSNQRTRQGGFVGTRIDITERKKMERALQESEAMLRGVLDAGPVPITMYRIDDGAIVYENPAARQLFGAAQGKPTIRANWASKEALDSFLEALSTRRALDGVEVEYKRAGGGTFWAAVSARLIEYRGEEVVVSAVYDLTERRAAEDKIAQQRELLHQSEKLSALGEVLAGVAHELNNPLSVVVGQALMLQEAAADPQIAKRAEKIGTAANRCARIVKTFLSMARHQQAERKPVEVNQVIEAALEVTGYSLRAAGVEVSLRLAKELPTIHADDHQLQQIVTNLIINAQHALEDAAGPRKLRITTSFRKKAGKVVIKIKDNGPGISEEIRGRIFEPLFTTKSVGTGTGIGLALCHRLVEAHGGSIEIAGPPQEGAVFVIQLPTDSAAAEAADVRAVAQAGPGGHRILVIDDEPDVADFLAEVLEYDGHQVALSISGEDTLRQLESQSFDIILSDIRMPEIDGPALYRILCERWPELVPVLAFITGDTLSSRVKEFLDSSGRPFVEKPITPAEIRELVARVAKGR